MPNLDLRTPESAILDTISESGVNLKRIVIVDPSLTDFLGHHAQYDLSIAKCAKKMGLDAAVISHRSISQEISDKVRAIAVFSEDMWGGHRIPGFDRERSRVEGPIVRVLRTFVFLFIGLLRTFSNRPLVGLRRPPISFFRKALILLLPPFLETTLKRIFFLPFKVAKLTLPNIAGILFAGVWRRLGDFPGVLSRAFLVPFLGNPLYEMEAREGLMKSGISDGDLVYFHMVIGRNLLETALLCEWIFSRTKVAPVVLFRYPPSETAGADPVSLGLAFRKLEWLFDKGMVRLASDSDRLIEEYSRVTPVPFELLPIPHGGILSDEGKAPSSENRPVTFVLPGNARAEKGIGEVFLAMRGLRGEEMAGRVHFVLQVNHPDREAAPWVEKLKSESFPFPVSLIDRVLDEKSYEALLSASDVVLAPYWKEVYASRTSGVALEALAGGRILITTEGTWMADEVQMWGNGIVARNKDPEDLQRAILEVVANFDELMVRAKEAGERSRAFHSGQNFVEHLLRKKVSRVLDRREILLVSDLNNGKGEGSERASRSFLLAKGLRRAGWDVTAIGMSKEEGLILGLRILDGEENNEFFFDNPDFLLDFLLRLMFFSKKTGMEKSQYKFRHWWRSRRSRLILNKTVKKCSGVLMESPFLADSVIPLAKAYGLKVALDIPDLLSSQTAKPSLKAWFLARESDAAKKADFLSCSREEDRRIFEGLGNAPTLIPSSLDMEYFGNSEHSAVLRILHEKGVPPSDSFGLYVGNGSHSDEEGLLLLSHLSQDISLRERNLQFLFVGTCKKGLSLQLPQTIFLLEEVSEEDLRVLYSRALFVISPVGGNGERTLEALACGAAVLGSREAFEGLDVENGTQCLIENDPGNFPTRICELIENPEYKSRISSKAKEFAWSRDYRTTFHPLMEVFGQVPGSRTIDGGSSQERSKGPDKKR